METEQLYQTYKPLLFSLAYQMLGSVMDAEDIVHDTFLAFDEHKKKEAIQNEKAFLCRMVTNRTIDKLRSSVQKRNVYIGTWLPEPLVEDINNPSESYLMKESISNAYLLLLQQLTETERSVFLLREVFQYDYDEIAAIVEKSAVNCRQIFHRSRKSMEARPNTDQTDFSKMKEYVEQFVGALQRADIGAMLASLKTDAVYKSDGGGKVKAALKPIHTAERIVRLLLGVMTELPKGTSFEYQIVNGGPGIIVLINNRVSYVVSFEFEEEKIDSIYMIANPDKLVHLNNGRM